MILAAGLGTRLKPWTLHHPKALVPVSGVPMLERVRDNLSARGFDEIIINVHHFADQVTDYIASKGWNDLRVSDESDLILDTGGGILRAEPLLRESGDAPFLVHNVDILSNADLAGLMHIHNLNGADCTLLVSDRDSSRKLIFDKKGRLKGWHSMKDDRYLPQGYTFEPGDKEYAFSGIHVLGPAVFDEMRRLGFEGKFPIMDFYLHPENRLKIYGSVSDSLQLLDIGKPDALERAEAFVNKNL